MTAWIQTWKLVALEPARFFRLVRTDQTGAALLFGVIGASIGTIVSGIFGFVSGNALFAMMRPALERMREQGMDPDVLQGILGGASGAVLVGQVVLAPVFALIGIYLLAALFHLVLLVVKGAPRGFGGTLTVVAYAYALYVLTALPMCGGLVAVVWFTVATIVGLAELHRAPTWKAAVAVFSPLLLLCLCACAAGLVASPLMQSLHPSKGGSVPL